MDRISITLVMTETRRDDDDAHGRKKLQRPRVELYNADFELRAFDSVRTSLLFDNNWRHIT